MSIGCSNLIRHCLDGGEFGLRMRCRPRPSGVGLALQHPVRPGRAATVFAGGDEAAVARCAPFCRIIRRRLPRSPCFATASPYT